MLSVFFNVLIKRYSQLIRGKIYQKITRKWGKVLMVVIPSVPPIYKQIECNICKTKCHILNFTRSFHINIVVPNLYSLFTLLYM